MLMGYKAWRGCLLPGLTLVGLYICNPTVYRAFGMVRPEAMLIPLFAGAGVLVLWSAEGSQARWPGIAVCSGMVSGIAVGVRQWGVFLEIALLLWMGIVMGRGLPRPSFLRSINERGSASRNENVGAISISRDEVDRTPKKVQPTNESCLWRSLGYFALQGMVFLGLAALFFSVRGGDVLTFNAPSQVPELAFVTDLELKALFTHPVRPAMNYRFWPVLYADFWGDYWRYWREALGRDPMPTSASVVTSLVRAMWASLPASWLMMAGFLLRSDRLAEGDGVQCRERLHTFSRIVIAVSLGGFLVFAMRYAEPGKGDTVKSIYLVYLVIFAAWLASAAVYVLARAFPRLKGLFLCVLALPFVYTLPNAVYHHPPQMRERTWGMPEVEHEVDEKFGEAITLVGYDVEVRDPKTLSVTLVWRVDAYPDGVGYKVFVHVRGPDNLLLAQSDAIPSNWSRPTQAWMIGEFITDRHILSLEAGELVSAERIWVGLYDPTTGQRLQTSSGDAYVEIELPAIEALP
jgi:hypothetical protein